MKLLFAIFVSALLVSAADPQTKKKTPAEPAANTVKPLEVPAGAVESEPGNFHYTDAQGKKWIYRKTPWGVARLEDKPSADAADSSKTKPTDNIKVTEDGDLLRFERPGPFGVYKWTRQKSELDQSEQAAWDRSRATAKQGK